MTSRGVQSDLLAITFQNRVTIPLGSSLSVPQKKGSLIYDCRLDKFYYSDGTQWLAVIASPGGNLICIEDTDGDTSVCTDTDPETDSDTIFFRTAGGAFSRAIFDPAGVLIATAGLVDPTTIVPAAGKVAHFEGDIKVTGVVDPTGTQYEEGTDHPVDPTATTTGVMWVRDDGPPNILVFTDNTGVDNDLTGPGSIEDLATTLVAGNFTGGTDIEVSTGDVVRGTDAATGLELTLRGGNGSGGVGGPASLTGGTGTTAIGEVVIATPAASAAIIGGDITISTGDHSGTVASGSVSISTGSNTLFGAGPVGGLTISAGDASAAGSSGSGGDVSISAGFANGEGTGGALTLAAGDATGPDTSGSGGDVDIRAGSAAGAGDGAGGALTLAAGSAIFDQGIGVGGTVDIRAGSAAGNFAGVGGDVTITSGSSASSSSGGSVAIVGGENTSTGASGGVAITSADTASAAGCGSIALTGGTSSSTGAPGPIFVTSGASSSTTTSGPISITTGDNSVIGAGSVGTLTLAGGDATGAGSTGNGGSVVVTTGTSVGGDVGSLLLGTGAGQTAHIVSTGLAPGVVFSGAGALTATSTDNCGTVTGLGSIAGTATFTFHTSFPTGSLVNVILTKIGAPATTGLYPFVTVPSITGFVITNPDTAVTDVAYMVMANI